MVRKLQEEDIQLIKLQYTALLNGQRRCERLQAKRDLVYLTYAGVFVLVSLAFIIMQSRGVVSDYRIGVICTGIGVLFCSIISMIFISPELDRMLVQQINDGKELEEKYPNTIISSYFRNVDSTRKTHFYATLLLRTAPLIFVGILTILAGISYIKKGNSILALSLGVGAGIILVISIAYVIRASRKILLSLK